MHIGILEDDLTQIELYKLWLSTAQHTFAVYQTVGLFLDALASGNKFDLLLLDRELPDSNGEKALEWVRENLGWELPVIFVTADGGEVNVVNVLRKGADDYIVKPPAYFELIARIQVWARRAKSPAPELVRIGKYEINFVNREIRLQSELIELTQKEFELAVYMLQHPGKLLSRMLLLEAIWGVQSMIDTRTVDTHVSRIRRKLKIFPENGWEIISVYGYGYRIDQIDLPAI
ncbi:response regulator transcription factor [Undibacterium squillarum]|uniref:DNA-binding response regulator n=1 Tax=Undibacterium squillarum TaxID=1131567 RepID=A0ABQ2XW71_9BURK|nr:response regulator transcription factor [Undibacterium squillarum]GGX36561.1 DNA-binding response regulator [Undibacterium squillarum]